MLKMGLITVEGMINIKATRHNNLNRGNVTMLNKNNENTIFF